MLLSVAITAHDEGLLLHKTLLCLQKALHFLDETDYEVILHIDNGSKAIDDYLKSGISPLKLNVYRNTFGDAGLSRNFCAKNAKGKYLFFIDADDLISDNFIKTALEMLKESKDRILVHQQACLTFEEQGQHTVLWLMDNGSRTEKDIYVLFEKNLWISSAIGEREIFLEHPYGETKNGIGFEDYGFNTETINAGIKHVVAPETMHFYRRKNSSLLGNSVKQFDTQCYSELFDFAAWKDFKVIDNKPKHKTNSLLKRGARKVIRKAANVAGIKRVAVKNPDVPEFVINEWKKINSIETQLYPTARALNEVEIYKPREYNAASAAYATICKETVEKPDYVFIVPWIIAGGADKVLINYTNAIKELWPSKKVCVITTRTSNNQWKDRLAGNTSFIDFGNVSAGMDAYTKELLFTRIIVQLQCKNIHIINSEYAYSWTSNHRALLNDYTVNLSLFCYDIIPGTNNEAIFDYADPYALDIYDLVKNIYTDNTATVKRLSEKYGFDKKKCIVHLQPCGYELTEKKARNNEDAFRILWASRVCPQKNPEILAKIMDALNKKGINDVVIDMYGRFDEDYNYSAKDFTGHSNLSYMGSFDGLNSIDLSNYDCLLYTSLIDGLPNILLEASAYGLPIIASNDGGVSDFIKDKETGLLVDDLNDPNKYVEAIMFAKGHRDELKKYNKNAQMLLKTQHDWKAFLNNIAKTMEIK